MRISDGKGDCYRNVGHSANDDYGRQMVGWGLRRYEAYSAMKLTAKGDCYENGGYDGGRDIYGGLQLMAGRGLQQDELTAG